MNFTHFNIMRASQICIHCNYVDSNNKKSIPLSLYLLKYNNGFINKCFIYCTPLSIVIYLFIYFYKITSRSNLWILQYYIAMAVLLLEIVYEIRDSV